MPDAAHHQSVLDQSQPTPPGLIKHDKKHRLKQRFEVKHKLGQGTYGKVQLAINKETGQEVAIKTIKKSKIQSEQDLVRIRREIQIMSSIQHPHIIHIYEVFENKEKIVLVMQYASGGELYEYVSDRKVLTDNEARRLFRQIATAVYYCHKNKVCHRDLKLENILLDHNGNAKIADFGLSNVFDEKHFLNTFCGSPLYASPEIVKGIPYFGAEVDCWSLGVLLYTLVYGAMPFDGSNFKRLVKQISESSYYEPKQKSEASGLIRRLLAVDPTKRATIIDICTDWWVNKGYEHSLLQVAEDLANLTPVRLDVLLALAPMSPSIAETESATHPLSGAQEPGDKKKHGKPRRSDDPTASTSATAIDYQADSSELTTDIPTYAEEEEELADASELVDDGEEFLPSAVAAALEEECQESGIPESTESMNDAGKSTKRVASTSFDQSMTRVSSHVMKKKKPKKGSEAASPIIESDDKQVSSSGYISDGTTTTATTLPASEVPKSEVKIDQHSAAGETGEDYDNKVPSESCRDETMSTISQVSSLPTQSNNKTETLIEPSHTSSSASIEKLTTKDSQITGQITTSETLPLTDELSSQVERQKSASSVKSKSKSASPKRAPSKSASTTLTKTGTTAGKIVTDRRFRSPEKSEKLSESRKKSLSQEKSDKDKNETLHSPPATEKSVSGSEPTTPEADGNKPWLERRSSVNRKVGKISYPKFLEPSSAPEKKPVPTYGKISTTKKMFEARRSSVDKDKERVIPMVKVSDAKRVFERRASMPASQAPLWKNAGERKPSLVTQSSLDSGTSRAAAAIASGAQSTNKQQPEVKSTITSRLRKSPQNSTNEAKRRSPNKSPVKRETEKSLTTKRSPEPNKSETKSEASKSSKPEAKIESELSNNEVKNELELSDEDQVAAKSEPSEVKQERSTSRSSQSPQKDNAIDEQEKKKAAKTIIKKQIAKAKLQELRQASVESSECATPPIVEPLTTTSRSSKPVVVSNEKPKSFAKTPQPFVKEELKPTPVRSTAEIKLTPKPKLGLNIEAANALHGLEEVTPTNIVEPSTADTQQQNQESIPGTPSTACTKAAPISRSYKKVTFTKDGACVTETGKIISEKGADGSFSRIEKKSKVTHYPTSAGVAAAASSLSTRSESSEETRTVRNFGGSFENDPRNGSASPPLVHSISGLRRSESASSSGSTDIFDDIFDTWSGDPVFSNISGRMRSMMSHGRSPFTSLWGTGRKRSKKKSRAESCERKPTAEGLHSSTWRRTGHGTDQEYSDTDTDTETSMGVSGGGLWKFLGPTPSSSNLLDRHRSLLSKHFGSDDLLGDFDNFGPSFRRSLSRDRGSTSFTSTRNSTTPTVRMVINPLRSRGSATRIGMSKQDSLDSNESGGNEPTIYPQTSGSFGSKTVTGRPYNRTISRESGNKSEDEAGFKSYDLDDGPSSRRRVEQWLDMSGDNEIDRNHPISMYTTIRPRTINRYGRSMSSRFGFDLGEPSRVPDRGSDHHPGSGSNLSFSTTQEIQIGGPIGDHVPSTPRSEVIIPVGRSSSNKPVIQMKLSLGGDELGRTFTTTEGSTTNTPSSTPDAGSEWSSPIVLPESSSLLEQLRTHGYRNLVSQRLSGLSGGGAGGGSAAVTVNLGDRYDTNRETSSTSSLPPTQQTKRGKRLIGDSSSTHTTTTTDITTTSPSRDTLTNENGYAWNAVNGHVKTKLTNNSMSPNLEPLETNIERENRLFNRINSFNTTTTNTSPTITTTIIPVEREGVNISAQKNSNNNRTINNNKVSDVSSDACGAAGDDGHDVGDDYYHGKPDDDGVIRLSSRNTIRNGGKDDDNSNIRNKINSKDSTANGFKSRKTNDLSNKLMTNIDMANNQDPVYSYSSSSFSSHQPNLASLPPRPSLSQSSRSSDELQQQKKQGLIINNNQINARSQQQQHHHFASNNLSASEKNVTKNLNNILNHPPQSLSPLPQTPPTSKHQLNVHSANNDNPSIGDNSPSISQHVENNCNTNDNNNVNTDDSTSSRSLTSTSDPSHKETLQERILRKSYYSRFNHPFEMRRSSSAVRRRSSLIENGDRLMDLPFYHDNNSSSRLFSPSTSGNSHHHSSYNNHHSQFTKPPLFLTNDQFIERVQIRAQQLIEEARERHARLNSQLMSNFRPTLTSDPYDFLCNSHLSSHRTSREPSPMLLRRTNSFSGSDQLDSTKYRRPSFSSNGSTRTPTTASVTSQPRTASIRLSNGHSHDLGDYDDDDDTQENHEALYNDPIHNRDDLTSHAQVVTEALQLLKERALQEH